MDFVNSPVWRNLVSDSKAIASTLISQFGLKYTKGELKLDDPLLRWMDFRLRYMPPAPRRIVVSKDFPKILRPDADAAFQHFRTLVGSGADLNPYQGKGLVLFDDISALKKKDRTDLLWADWGITHFHLTTAPLTPASFFSDRSPWLLFAIATEDTFAALDIREHDEPNVFSRIEMIATLVDSWPSLMERFELKGILPSTPALTSEQYAKLRNAGINTAISVNGKSYLGPGLGLTAAATPLRGQVAIDHIKMHLNSISRGILDPKSEYNRGVNTGVDETSFSLKTSRHGITLLDQRINKAWIPPPSHLGINNDLARISDLILPSWFIPKIQSFDLDLV